MVAASGLDNPQRSFGKTAKLSAVWDIGGRVAQQGFLFVVSIFIARLLTPADFGITAAARFFVTLATRITQLGLNVSLIRMKEIKPEHASSVFVVNLVMGVLAFFTLYLASPTIGRLFGSSSVAEVLPVTAAVFLITPLASVPGAMMVRQLRYRASTAIHLLDAVAGSIITLGLAFLDFGYWSLVLGALAGTVLSTAVRVYMSPWRLSLRFSSSALRDTLSFGTGFQVKQLLTFGATNLDNLVVGRLLGVTSLGFYDKAYGLMRQMTDRFAFDTALMRIFAVINHEPDRFRKALLKGTLATTLVTFPILCFVGVGADELILVLYGSQWLPAVGPFYSLAVAGVLKSAMRPMHAANESLGLVWLQTIQQLAYAVLIVVGVAVGSYWGVSGAAAGVLPGLLVQLAFGVRLLTRNSTVTAGDLWSAVWPSIASSAAMCAGVLGVEVALRSLGVLPWLVLLAMIATAGVSYAALLLWTPFPTVAAVVRESVDDVAPWARRWVAFGILRVRSQKNSDRDLDAPGPAAKAKATS
ncbi:MAG: lipopolysaccharide biosynthesis protein [Acidobacteria bacterium]|nr:lipopolysaccharide biosynthesis protein [Acidobacteriota bacterium]